MQGISLTSTAIPLHFYEKCLRRLSFWTERTFVTQMAKQKYEAAQVTVGMGQPMDEGKGEPGKGKGTGNLL